MTDQQHPVVAELGRPETQEETAARTAESSRNHRNRQTINNLVLSLLATLGVVVIIILIVPRAQPVTHAAVDYAAIAAQGQGTEPDPLVSPNLPNSWHANSAELRTDTAGGIDSWYIGLITPSQQYIGITQGFNTDRTWLAGQVKNSQTTTTVTVDGVTWTVYDNRHSSRDVGNVEYAMTTTAGASTYILFGTADSNEFSTVARAIDTQVSR